MLKVFLGWVVTLVVIGAGAYLAFAEGALTVAEIRVEGVRLVDHEKVKAALAEAVNRPPRSWFGSDLTPFWLFLDPSESFLASFPMFRAVEVETDLFARDVVIRADERELYGVWCLIKTAEPSGMRDAGEGIGTGEQCYAFDRDGVAFWSAPATQGTLITKVADARSAAFQPGEAVLSDAEWRSRMLETLAILDTLRLTPRLITVREETLREWEVALVEGPTLKFSFTFVPPGLEGALAVLSRRGDFRALTYLDFRVSDRLYYK